MFGKRMDETKKDLERVVKWTYVTYAMIIGAWIVAWVFKLQLDRMNAGETNLGSFVYWTSAKLLLWIIPALWLIRLSGRSLQQVFNISNYKSWLLWGGGIGLGIALTGFIPNYLQGKALLPSQWSYALVNVLVIAPIFEELLIRGAILENLQKQYTFSRANVISSLMFVGLHVPGWFFTGHLMENVTKPIGGAFSIFLIGLLFGYAVKRSDSVMGGIMAHFFNNLA